MGVVNEGIGNEFKASIMMNIKRMKRKGQNRKYIKSIIQG